MSAIFPIEEMDKASNALENAGWTSNDMIKLTQCKKLKELRAFVNGFAKLEMIDHLIDCDVLPKRKEITAYKIKKHKKMVMILYNPEEVSLFQFGDSMRISEAIKLYAKKPFMNADVLEYLLEHQELIPEDWKDKRIFFLNSVYVDYFKREVVRYMVWDRHLKYWGEGLYGVGEKFKPNHAALLMESCPESKSDVHLIDCDANPLIPDEWKIEEHRKGGLISFDPLKNYLYLSKNRRGEVLPGTICEKNYPTNQ